MDLKEKVSKLHQRIKKLGYADFKRTHVQEVLATALGYNNFHALKSKENHDLSKMDKLKGCKKFIIKTDSSTGDDFKRIEAMIVSIPLDVIFLINRVLGKERFDLVDQFVIKTNKVQLNNLDEFSNDLQYELDNNPFIGLQNNNFINASYDGEVIDFKIGLKINPDYDVQIFLDKNDNHKILFTHTYKYEQVFYEAFFDIETLNQTLVFKEDE